MFVVAPVTVETNRAVQSPLEHSPSSASCCLVTEYLKGSHVIRFDGINTVGWFTRWFVDFSTVLESYKDRGKFECHLIFRFYSTSLNRDTIRASNSMVLISAFSLFCFRQRKNGSRHSRLYFTTTFYFQHIEQHLIKKIAINLPYMVFARGHHWPFPFSDIIEQYFIKLYCTTTNS